MADHMDRDLDEAFDALNNETFGGEEDEWEWGGGGADGLCPSPNQLSLDHGPVTVTTTASRPMHSSNLMVSMSSIANVSGIRRLSDIEKSFSSIGLQDDSGDLPDDPAIMKFTKSPHQPLMSSLLHDSTSSDPFSSFSINPSRLSSSVWAPPDQSLFDSTSSMPQSLTSGSPVPPAPPSDPWKNAPKQSSSADIANNNKNHSLASILTGMTPAKTGVSGEAVSGVKVIQKPMSLEELEASFLTDSSPKQQQQEQKSPNQGPRQRQPQERVIGRTPPGIPSPAHQQQQQLLERQMRAAEPNRLPHPLQMMPMAMHPQIGMPFPMIRPMPPGRVNLIQHPQVQQNFLLLQQAPYRPQHQIPPHPFLNQQQMYNMQMQQQQRMPYHRVNYLNNSINRMPMQGPEPTARRPVDECAGFMSQKEREWLIKIQKLQLESSITDPYVEDYYAMCYNSKVRSE